METPFLSWYAKNTKLLLRCYNSQKQYSNSSLYAIFLQNYDHLTAIFADWKIDMAKPMARVEFLRSKLSADEKREFMEWRESNTLNTQQMIEELAQFQYKITVSLDLERNSAICSATGKPGHSHNAGRCITSRHTDLAWCIELTFFKVAVLFDWGKWSVEEPEEDWG